MLCAGAVVTFATDLAQSSDCFDRLVWPVLAPLIGDGARVVIESTTDSTLAADLDRLAGIDAWQIVRPHGMRGIASRVQATDRPWDTFTVRMSRSTGAETEYVKRIRAMDSGCGWLFPHLTIQAYVSTARDRLLSVAAIRTEDLFKHVRDCTDGCTRKTNGHDGNRFAVVPWVHVQWQPAPWAAAGKIRLRVWRHSR